MSFCKNNYTIFWVGEWNGAKEKVSDIFFFFAFFFDVSRLIAAARRHGRLQDVKVTTMHGGQMS